MLWSPVMGFVILFPSFGLMAPKLKSTGSGIGPGLSRGG